MAHLRDHLAGRQVPQARDVIPATRQDLATVRAKGRKPYTVRVCELGRQPARGSFPHVNIRRIPDVVGGQKLLAVRAEFHVPHGRSQGQRRTVSTAWLSSPKADLPFGLPPAFPRRKGRSLTEIRDQGAVARRSRVHNERSSDLKRLEQQLAGAGIARLKPRTALVGD